MALRVILGEDSYLAIEGIARVLERAGDFKLLSTHGDLDSLTNAVAEQRPDVVLTDIRMPPMSTDEGIRLANGLRDTSAVLSRPHCSTSPALESWHHGHDTCVHQCGSGAAGVPSKAEEYVGRTDISDPDSKARPAAEVLVVDDHAAAEPSTSCDPSDSAVRAPLSPLQTEPDTRGP